MAAPFTISIREDFARLSHKMAVLARDQIPFAASQAANRLARIALSDLQAHMRKVFDRPTPFTLRGFYARLGTKRDPHGEILAREFAGKGTPASKYLQAEALGGDRRLKRFEAALGYQTGEALFTIPGRGAKLNSHGNMTQGQINKVMAALGAGSATSRTPGRTGRGDTYFLAHSKKDGSLLGVYRVVSTGHVEPVLIFTKRAPQYRVRFRFDDVIMGSVRKNSPQVFDEELAKAIKTAR